MLGERSVGMCRALFLLAPICPKYTIFIVRFTVLLVSKSIPKVGNIQFQLLIVYNSLWCDNFRF
jgi:hypothetical protein